MRSSDHSIFIWTKVLSFFVFSFVLTYFFYSEFFFTRFIFLSCSFYVYKLNVASIFPLFFFFICVLIVMVPINMVMDYITTLWHSGRSPPSRVECMHYSLGGSGLGHTSVGRVLSVRGSGRLCPGSSGSRSRWTLTGILVPRGGIVPPGSYPPWRG